MGSNPEWYMKEYRAKNGKANYKKYQGTKSAILNRAKRNAARKKMWVKDWNLEVDHKDWNPQNNSRSNLRVISRKLNRKLGWASKKRTDWKLG